MRVCLFRLLQCVMLVIAFSLPLSVRAEPVPYTDLALGLGIHTLEASDDGAASKLIKAGMGVQWFSFLSTQLGVWSWNTEDQGENKQEKDDEKRNAGSFNGLSGSLEVTLIWPIENNEGLISAGPYYRYGRHCWSAVLSGLVEPWSKKGCSGLNTLGFSFPSGKEKHAGLYVELSQTDFDDLFSRSLQLGVKLAF